MNLVWVRALVASFGSATCYASVYYVPLSIFMTLFHLRPFPTSFICWLVLGERSSRIQIIASGKSFYRLSSTQFKRFQTLSWADIIAVISFLSVILVVQPDFVFARGVHEDRTPWQTFLGTTLTLLCMLLGAFDSRCR